MILTSHSMVPCVQLNRGICSTYVFRSYSDRDMKLKPTTRKTLYSNAGLHSRMVLRPDTTSKPNVELSIWQVARATTAAPTFFSPIEIEGAKFTDGALLSNNPTLEVLKEAALFRDRGNTAFCCILSIGTGVAPTESQRHSGLSSTQRALFASLRTSTATVNSQIKELLPDPDCYWRFEPKEALEPNRQRRDTLEDILRKAARDLHKGGVEKQGLAKVARILVKQRRARADTPAWESFALHVSYTCKRTPCSHSAAFPNRQALSRHWERDHDEEVPDESMLADVEAELDNCRQFN